MKCTRSSAERVRASIALREFQTPSGETVKVTVSMGLVASRINQPMDLSSMLSAVDHCLYQAKRSGRNRLVVGPPAYAEPSLSVETTLDF